MEWVINHSQTFEAWWRKLTLAEKTDVTAVVTLLRVKGPTLPFPYSSKIQASRHGAMRELRIQHHGRPYRVLYAFDPKRQAFLLLGGDKTGDDRWYDVNVPVADRLFDQYLSDLEA